MAEGLTRKYQVLRHDGRDGSGQKHEGCEYFVLDLTHDEIARQAFLHYVGLVRRDQPGLFADAIRLIERMRGRCEQGPPENTDPPLSWDPEDVAWSPTPPGHGDDGSAPPPELP